MSSAVRAGLTNGEVLRPSVSDGVSPRRDVTEFGLRRVFIVIGVMAAALMQTLDSTITNVALPNITGNLGMSQDEGTWVVTAYTIAAIIVIPITPWLQDRFGRKNYFVVSILGFTIASMICGIATSATQIILWRVVQGAFGGGILATGQAIMRDTFPTKQLGISQGIFALGAIMGPALGPPLGGWLVDNASWNWCFFINLLPGCVSILFLWTMLRDPTSPRRLPVDGVGLALLAAGLGTMQYVLTEGEPNYWFADPWICAASLICITALVLFVVNELRGTDHPIVDLRILRNRSVAAGSILAFALGMTVFGSSYTLPQFSQGVLGFTPTLSGLLFVIRAVPIALFILPIVRLMPRIDTRWFLASGFALVAIGMWRMGIITTPEASFWTFGPPLFLTGVGSAMLFVPLTTSVLAATSPAEGPKAVAFVNLALQLGGSVSVALLDVLLDRRLEFFSTSLDASARLGRPVVQQFLDNGGSLRQLAEVIYGQAAALAYADLNYFIAAICVISAPLILLIRKRQSTSPSHIDIAG